MSSQLSPSEPKDSGLKACRIALEKLDPQLVFKQRMGPEIHLAGQLAALTMGVRGRPNATVLIDYRTDSLPRRRRGAQRFGME